MSLVNFGGRSPAGASRDARRELTKCCRVAAFFEFRPVRTSAKADGDPISVGGVGQVLGVDRQDGPGLEGLHACNEGGDLALEGALGRRLGPGQLDALALEVGGRGVDVRGEALQDGRRGREGRVFFDHCFGGWGQGWPRGIDERSPAILKA